MASEEAAAKRAKPLASRVHWSNRERFSNAQDPEAQRAWKQDNVREWLTITVTEEDAKHVPLNEAAEPLSRNSSSDDDLALGVEASLYGKHGVKTVQDFLRWSLSYSDLSRINIFNSANSDHPGLLSVMDIIKLWNDDPEEVLLDLGFGCNEPDLSGRIPARFINYPSQARGINLQVFLEAQQQRLDLESPDVSNRFRQLEVLHEVTAAFSSLMGTSSSSPLRPTVPRKDLPPDAHERRKRMGMLLRRVSKKSLNQIHNNNAQDISTHASPAPESALPPPDLRGKTAPVKRVKQLFQESSLSPLEEEKGDFPDIQCQAVSFITQEAALRPGQLKDSDTRTTHGILQKIRCQARDSFEMEEIQSCDEGSVTGNVTGGEENSVRGVVRTNSCQSDSSGFLEEPFIPSAPQQASLGPDLIKALYGLSGESTESQFSDRAASSSPPCTSSSPPIGSPVAVLSTEKPLLPSSCASPQHLFISPTSPKSDMHCSDSTRPNQQEAHHFLSSISPSVGELVSPPLMTQKLEITSELEPVVVPSATCAGALPATSCLIKPTALTGGSEDMQTENKDAPPPCLPTYDHVSEVPAHTVLSDVPSVTSFFSPLETFDPSCFATFSVDSVQTDSLWQSRGTQSESNKQTSKVEDLSLFGDILSPYYSSLSLDQKDAHSPPSYTAAAMSLTAEDLMHNVDTSCEENSPKNKDVTAFSDSNMGEQTEDEPNPSPLSLNKGTLSPPSSFFSDTSKLEKDCPLSHLSFDTPNSISSSPSSSSYITGDSIGPDVGRLSEVADPKFSHSDDIIKLTSVASIQDTTHIQNLSSLGTEGILQKTEKEEGERQSNMMQTDEFHFDKSSVTILAGASEFDSEEVCCEAEADLQVCSPSFYDDLEYNKPDLDAKSFSDPKQGKQIEEEATMCVLSSNNKDPSPTLLFFSDSSKSEDSSTLPCLSFYPPEFMDSAFGRISELAEQSFSHQDRSSDHHDSININSVSPIQNIASHQMDNSSLESENTLQKTGNGRRKSHTNIVQTHESVNNISTTKFFTVLTEGSDIVSEEVCYETDEDLQFSLHDDNSPQSKQEVYGNVLKLEIDATESQTPNSPFFVFDGVPEAHSRTHQQLNIPELIEVESLDLVFETSVDGSEFDGEDVDAIFQELDTEGLVCWAEPIQISNSTPVFEEPASFKTIEGSHENYSLPRNSATPKDPTTFSSFSSTNKLQSVNADVPLIENDSTDRPSSLTQEHRLSLSSVSVQMSSCPSSHIVHRKDVPYTTDSKQTLIPGVVTLDTSTPFCAVQSWTDQQIQRNTVNQKISHGSKNNFSCAETRLTHASEMAHRTPEIFSLTPSFDRMSNDCQSHDCLPGLSQNFSTLSESVNTGLSPDEEVDRIYKEDMGKVRESNQVTSMPCCCSCGGRCCSCTRESVTKQHSLPYSVDELEEMVICLQRFRSVLSNMEEQLSEDQASVYSVLSDHDREKVQNIEKLRGEVKKEAGELELHLEELVNHCDESFKMVTKSHNSLCLSVTNEDICSNITFSRIKMG
ncbi:uncharacterized protein LOC117509307 [Thalassophryne amazonica]|uniref:uncharacterized protein LOC117509307 n=1 Tax=Thalassophryne amazonica TaxID=390379 RepID=UPI001471C817|nr:uncharacterized protein LOC117509307 [Thalassophryne amazonica]